MTELPIPIPPQLLAALNYPGHDARLVSLCWTNCGDTSWYDDGRSSGTGNGWSYLAFARHPAILPHLAAWDIGSSEADGTHRLLLDLATGTVSVGTAAEVREALRDQWPEECDPVLTAGQMDAVVEHVRRAWLARPTPTAEQLMTSMRAHSRLVSEMIAWLDAWKEEQR